MAELFLNGLADSNIGNCNQSEELAIYHHQSRRSQAGAGFAILFAVWHFEILYFAFGYQFILKQPGQFITAPQPHFDGAFADGIRPGMTEHIDPGLIDIQVYAIFQGSDAHSHWTEIKSGEEKLFSAGKTVPASFGCAGIRLGISQVCLEIGCYCIIKPGIGGGGPLLVHG